MKTIVLSCSKRFYQEAYRFVQPLEKAGVVIFKPALYEWTFLDADLNPDQKKLVTAGLTFLHFQRIKQADVMFVYNKNGYIGNSVTLELGYAVAMGMPIYSLELDQTEIAREVLMTAVCPNARDLLQKVS